MADNKPPDLDVLRRIGAAAMSRQQLGPLGTSVTDGLLYSRRRRATFATAAWVAGASHSQIADVFKIKPPSVQAIIAATIPSEVRRVVAKDRNTGRALISFERVELMRELFDLHPDWLDVATTAKAFSEMPEKESE